MNKMANIAVLTSGGDAPGMNAAIRAVVRTGVYYNRKVFGFYRGYQGLIDNDITDLNARSVGHIIDRGGTILKTARSQKFRTVEGREKASNSLKKNQIDGLIVIGGNGTFAGAHLLYQEHGIPVIGIPGTIDNDLYGTSETIGYDTATNVAVECIDKIRDTAHSHNRLFFIEVMGRDSGNIALKSGIASGAISIVIPEENQSIDELVDTLNNNQQSHKSSSIVIVSEGDKLGGAYDIAKAVMEKSPEYDTKVTILGHIQRGGSPTCQDRVLASQMGTLSVEALLNNKKDVMIGVINDKMKFTALENAVNIRAGIDNELVRISKIISI